jgi:nitroreductase
MDPGSRWWVEDGAASIENMLIAATALGYGTCWLEGYTRERELDFKVALNIPENLRLMTLVPIGVPVEWPVKDKKTLAEVIHWEKF